MSTIYEQINLRKDKVVSIAQAQGIEVGKARVVVAIDFSGSMSSLYSSGAVQRLVERLLPVGMAMDSNEEIDFYIFEDSYVKTASVTVSNIKNYIDKHIIGKYSMGGTSYAPIINAIVKDAGGTNEGHSVESFSQNKGFLGSLFGKAKEALHAVKDKISGPTPKKFEQPTYVIFITDGENCDKQAAMQAIINASYFGIFFQFIGIGRETFSFLRKLDTMEGRLIDNANFFPTPDLDKVSDDELYKLLLTEYPTWIPQAKAKGLI